MVFIIILLLVIIAILSYLLYINYNRAEKAVVYCETYVRFILALYMKFTSTRADMKEIDRIGAFQADDEVGHIFKDLDQSIDDLYIFITKYINTDDSNQDKDKKTEN